MQGGDQPDCKAIVTSFPSLLFCATVPESYRALNSVQNGAAGAAEIVLSKAAEQLLISLLSLYSFLT